MKASIRKNVIKCDFCSAVDDYMKPCMSCGKDLCYKCLGDRRYPHAVYFSGSGDGHYCANCDAFYRANGKDERFNAYRRITWLRQEAETWGKAFKERCDAVEAEITKHNK